MKRLLLIPLLFLCSTLWAAEPVQLARMNPYIAGAGVAVSACTTTIPSSSNTRDSAASDGQFAIGSETARYYVGQKVTSPGSHTVCKVSWRIGSLAGDVSAKTLYSQIWTLSGTSLDILVEESATTYTGVTQYTVYSFTHTASITDANDYAFVITMKGTDGTNYPNISYFLSDKDNGYSGYARWNEDKTQAGAIADNDCKGQFYE